MHANRTLIALAIAGSALFGLSPAGVSASSGSLPADIATQPALSRTVTIDGRQVEVSIGSTGDGVTRLRVAVKGIHPGLVAHLCDQAGLQIVGMKRIRIGRLPLSTLEPGQWRLLMPYERF